MLIASTLLVRLLLFAALGLIAYLSLMPYEGELLANNRDKTAHLVVYGGLMVLALWAYSPAKWLIAALALLLYSIALELGQILVPTRHFSYYDIIANAVGIALGYAIVKVMQTIKNRYL